MQSFLSFFKIESKKCKKFYLVILFIISLFIIAYIHNNNIAYIAMFSLFSVALISFALGRLNIKNIQLELLHHPDIFANEKFLYKAQLSGKGYGIFLREKKYNLDGKLLIDLEYSFAKRGIHTIESETLFSFYPLALVKFIKRVSLNKEILVYPELKGKSLEEALLSGNSFIGYKDEFEGIKPYSSSDNITDIHWPSVAKGEIASKKFSYISEEESLCFDLSLLGGSLEERISQIALWSVEAQKKGYKYKVRIAQKELKDLDEILTTLALY